MAYYLIKYLDGSGNKISREFEGDSKFDAIEKSDIDANTILSINKSFAFGSRDLNIETQELIISEIRAISYSGQAMHQGVISILGRADVKHSNIADIVDDGSTISDILSLVGISKPIVALVASGESSGRLQAALNSSMVYLETQKKIQEQVRSPFLEGALIVGIAFAMVMFLPNIIAPALKSLTTTLNADTNFMTDILLFIYYNDSYIWLSLFIIVIIFTIFRKRLWLISAKLPLLRVISEFFIIRRSVLMLMIFKPLFESNISLNKALIIIKSSMSSDADVVAVQLLIDKMNKGDALSKAITNSKDWSPVFYNSFASFEKSVLSAQLELIESITFALLSRLTVISKRISTIANLSGKFIGFFALMMIVIGYYFPSLTASV